MSVDTKARLLGRVEPEEIIDYMKKHWSVEKISNSIKKNNLPSKFKKDVSKMVKEFYDEEMYYIRGHINYTYKREERILYYWYGSYNTYENLNYYKEKNLENMIKTETTQLVLGNWGHSVEMLKDLVSYFGGWLDCNDCDDEPYYYIEGTRPKINPIPVIHVTRKELNEKFGGIVIIDD